MCVHEYLSGEPDDYRPLGNHALVGWHLVGGHLSEHVLVGGHVSGNPCRQLLLLLLEWVVGGGGHGVLVERGLHRHHADRLLPGGRLCHPSRHCRPGCARYVFGLKFEKKILMESCCLLANI